MKAALAVLGGLVGLVLLVAILCGAGYISANNYGAQVESQLKAARDDNKNILAQYQQKILEAAQVPSMYKDDLKEVATSVMQGRYGPDGSKALMNWIKENNLDFDSSMYTKLQTIIESGRKDFEVGQTRMIDIRRGYEAQLGYFWRGLWLRIAGFPKIDMKDFAPITTDGVETTYKNGKEAGPLQLRK